MNKDNIITSFRIPGARVASTPVGVVHTGWYTSTERVLDAAVRTGNELGADWIVGFMFESQSANKRVDRKWRGFGTAVKLS